MDLSSLEPQLNLTSWIGNSNQNTQNKIYLITNKKRSNYNNKKSQQQFKDKLRNNIYNIQIEENNKNTSNGNIKKILNSNKYKTKHYQSNSTPKLKHQDIKNNNSNLNHNIINNLKQKIKEIIETLSQRFSQMSASKYNLNPFRSSKSSFSPKPSSSYTINHLHWLLPRTLQRRLLLKNGDYNIASVHIDKRSRHYLADLFTTLIDLQWRVDLLIFAATFTMSWLFFGFVWWFISFIHDDFENKDKPGWEPCLREVHDFRSALLLSIETQQTIGYGFRNVTTKCSAAVITIMFQSCFGLIIQALMTGLIFAKLSRPKKRAQTLMFSQKAVICERDKALCLLFRIADMRKSQIVEAHVRAFMVLKKVTMEGEVVSFHQHNLRLDTSDEEGRLFLAWPSTVEHKITEDSPLWDISATDLVHRHFEIVVIMEGIVESTGMTTQARTSYLPSEILWGHRFDAVVSFKAESGQYVVDFAKLNSTTPFSILGLSAKERYEKTLGETDEVKECSKIFSETAGSNFGSNENCQKANTFFKKEEKFVNKKECSKDVKLHVLEERCCKKSSGKSSLNTSNSADETKNSNEENSFLTKMVASHVASTAFNVIGATTLLPSKDNLNNTS